MKQKISNHVKNNWQEYASVILMLFIITVAMIYKFNQAEMTLVCL